MDDCTNPIPAAVECVRTIRQVRDISRVRRIGALALSRSVRRPVRTSGRPPDLGHGSALTWPPPAGHSDEEVPGFPGLPVDGAVCSEAGGRVGISNAQVWVPGCDVIVRAGRASDFEVHVHTVPVDGSTLIRILVRHVTYPLPLGHRCPRRYLKPPFHVLQPKHRAARGLDLHQSTGTGTATGKNHASRKRRYNSDQSAGLDESPIVVFAVNIDAAMSTLVGASFRLVRSWSRTKIVGRARTLGSLRIENQR